jgi:hypothetical protein
LQQPFKDEQIKLWLAVTSLNSPLCGSWEGPPFDRTPSRGFSRCSGALTLEECAPARRSEARYGVSAQGSWRLQEHIPVRRVDGSQGTISALGAPWGLRGFMSRMITQWPASIRSIASGRGQSFEQSNRVAVGDATKVGRETFVIAVQTDIPLMPEAIEAAPTMGR